MAGQNAYREIVSCSNCLDYQARRLKIRFRDKTNEDTKYVHTLNSTLIATTRILVSIMENFSNKRWAHKNSLCFTKIHGKSKGRSSNIPLYFGFKGR